VAPTIVAMFDREQLHIVSLLDSLTLMQWTNKFVDGIDGADKVILIEYSMPMDGKTGFNADMPSIWMLNAQIPRTLQYGDASCSCWESGCGE